MTGLIKKRIVQIIKNFIVIYIGLFILIFSVAFIGWNLQGDSREVDISSLAILSLVGIGLYSAIFIIIHSVFSLICKRAFNIIQNKIMIVIAFISYYLSEYLDISHYLINNKDIRILINLILYNIVMLVLYSFYLGYKEKRYIRQAQD